MQIQTINTPSFDELETWQKSLLLDPLVDVIKEFYSKEKNRSAFQKWIADGKPMGEIKKGVQHEQMRMAI